MAVNIPRPEHPKPQFARADWLNLNGEWAFEIDNGCSGRERGLSAADAQLSGKITVPFCPQSTLSGVAHTDFLRGVWYRRTVTLTAAQCAGHVMLHFGAVDYRCEAFVNGRRQFDPLLSLVYRVTKAADPSRPCIDTSGNYHVETDIYDVHDYTAEAEVLHEHYDALPTENRLEEWGTMASRQRYDGKKPVFVSECGGIGWISDANDQAWGYGNNPTTQEEFVERFRTMADIMMQNPRIIDLCYTQLTNVEQEQNGLYTYEREPKFDPAIFRAILSQKAAIED